MLAGTGKIAIEIPPGIAFRRNHDNPKAFGWTADPTECSGRDSDHPVCIGKGSSASSGNGPPGHHADQMCPIVGRAMHIRVESVSRHGDALEGGW